MGINFIAQTITNPRSIKVLAAIDNPTSILPVAAKDMIDNAGKTMMAKGEGGKHEGREKGVEEYGTSLLWLAGIPACRKLIDLGFKAYSAITGNKIDPGVHLKKVMSSVQGNELRFTEAQKNLYRNANVLKTAVSIAIPLALIIKVLPDLNQKFTRCLVHKEYKNKSCKNGQANNNSENNINIKHKSHRSLRDAAANTNFTSSELYSSFMNLEKGSKGKDNKKVSFTGIGTAIGKFFSDKSIIAQVNPVGNMIALDLGISSNRIAPKIEYDKEHNKFTVASKEIGREDKKVRIFGLSRNAQESAERIVNEAGVIFFFYFAADKIGNFINKMAEKAGVPIDLDLRVLNSDEFKKTMKKITNDPAAKQSFNSTISEFKNAGEEAIFKTVKRDFSKGENFVLNMATESGIVKTAKNQPKFFGLIKKQADKLKNALAKLGFSENQILKDTNGRILDSRKYIETKEINKLSQKLEKFTQKMGKDPEAFIQKAKLYKGLGVIANFVICTAALAYGLPKLQYFIREKVFGSKEFPGERAYKEEAQKLYAKKLN